MPLKDPVARKEYQKQYHKKYYELNKEDIVDRNHKRNKLNTEWFNSYKKTLCCDRSGFSDYRALEFHHKIRVNSNSSRLRVSGIVQRCGWSTQRIQKYIKETFIVLCANCHRITHYDDK